MAQGLHCAPWHLWHGPVVQFCPQLLGWVDLFLGLLWGFQLQGTNRGHILLDKPFWVFVDVVVIPLEQNSISVGKVKCIWLGFGLAELFHFLDDGFWHGVCRQLPLLDLFFSDCVEKLVGAL
jgi:hypothetical protein